MKKGILFALFIVIVVSLILYYRCEWYSFAEYIKFLSFLFGINLFIFIAVLVKFASKEIVYFFGTLSAIGFVLMMIFYNFVNVEIYDLSTHETKFYFKKDNLKGAYIYNPDNKCYEIAYNGKNLVFVKIWNTLQRVSFNTDIKFGIYIPFIDQKNKNVDIYIKDCS